MSAVQDRYQVLRLRRMRFAATGLLASMAALNVVTGVCPWRGPWLG